MANLATLASTFTNLETQKKNIATSVSELEALKESNIEGQLSFVVSSISGDVTDTVSLTVTPSEANISLAKLKDLRVGKSTELQLTTKQIIVGVACTVPSAATPSSDAVASSEEGEGAAVAAPAVVYKADFEVKEVEDNETMTTELELQSKDNETLVVHIKVAYETISGLLASKLVELQQVELAKAKVLEDIKKAKSKPGPKKEKKSKKGARQEVVEESSAAFDVDEDETSAFTRVVAGATEVAMTSLQLGMTHRAVVLFGVASWAIFTLGEYASI